MAPEDNQSIVHRMALPKDITERLQRLDLSEEFLESACCNLVAQKLGIDPFISNEQRDRDIQVSHTLNTDPTFGSDQPIWKGWIYHVLNHVEMNVAISKVNGW